MSVTFSHHPLRSQRARLKAAAKAWTIPTSGARPLPDFLIIGAQRCGTTSLYKYLLQHPAFLPAAVATKGVHFFDTHYGKGISWYRSHFPTAVRRRAHGALHRTTVVTGEASPYYLFHPQVPQRIAQHMPNALLIAVLRDPVERAYSQWQHEVAKGFERYQIFENALDAEAGRLAGEIRQLEADADHRSPAHQHWSYLARGDYATQLERYLAVFPAEQLLVLKAEELFTQPDVEYARVESFLGLPAHPPAAFDKHNGYRRAPMNPVTRARLVEHFAEPNRRLVEMLGPTFRWDY